jgi:hypothetical protein
MLDAIDQIRPSLALGMGNLTRNEELAEYYLRAAGVAAVWIDADGHVGAEDVARIKADPDRVTYCCVRGVHFTLAYRLFEWKSGVAADQSLIAAKLQEIAELGGVAVTPHDVAIRRALAAVARVNRTLDEMGSSGELKDLNCAFKAARKIDPSLRYHDYLHAHKAGMIEQIASEGQS